MGSTQSTWGSCSSLSIVNLLNRTFTFDQSKSPVKHPHPINSPTMPTGSCFCDGVKIEYSGEPAMTALCHCADCRHISGGLYSHDPVQIWRYLRRRGRHENHQGGCR